MSLGDIGFGVTVEIKFYFGVVKPLLCPLLRLIPLILLAPSNELIVLVVLQLHALIDVSLFIFSPLSVMLRIS